ncbi:anti-sigma factor [Arthrobacter gandavensis]|uniref:anti-sigma factor n=1 Tax=Arthrobacter gandavensis TaxID=169960 RepID=UPI00188F6D27|nr:anti-sigma factor [Arthrobacter gandavensis]MBF4993372.1 anti-sigma factor [Arthrobacter gandavensis]
MNDQYPGSGVHELAPLSAIDALDPAERSAFEEHLAGCARCRSEVADFAEVSAHLAAGAEQEPPAELRSSVLASIHGTRPAPGPRKQPADHTRPLDVSGRDHAAPADAPIPLHRRRRRVLLAAAAAALLLPAAGLAGWALGIQSEQGQQQQAQQQSREDRLLAAADLSVQRLDVNGQQSTLLVSEQEDAALFLAGDLPDPGADREYQLWLLEDDTPVPDVHFGGGAVRVWLSGDVSRAGTVALTIEPAGGSTTPTFPVVAAAEI